MSDQDAEIEELRRLLSIAEARIRVQDRVINKLPRTLDGISITPGMAVFIPFKGIRMARSGVRADGYYEDQVASIDWHRGKARYMVHSDYNLNSQPCYSSAEECLLANPKNAADSERFLELAMANAREIKRKRLA